MILPGQVLMRRVTSVGATSPFHFRSGLAVSFETFLAEAEGVGLALPGGRRLDFPLCFPARRGLCVVQTGVDDHSPEPPDLGPVAPLLGQNGGRKRGQESKNDFLASMHPKNGS
jgi:hypothetical protein